MFRDDVVIDFIVIVILKKIKDMLEKKTDLLIQCDMLEDLISDKLDNLLYIRNK